MSDPKGVAAPALLRRLRRVDIVALTINAIVGAGIFAMPAGLTAAAGRWSIAVLAAAIVLITLCALSLAEVASRYEVTGGPQVYARDAFGPLAGYTVGWLLVISRLASFAALSHVMMNYAGAVAPALDAPLPRTTGIVFVTALLAFLNLRGIASGALTVKIVTLAKLLPLVALALAGLWLAGWNDFPATEPTQPDGLKDGLLLALFACVGFEPASMVAGEARDPKRDLAAGILTGLAITCLLYLLLMFACFALLPDPAASSRPLAEVATILVGPAGGILVAIGAVFSCAGVLAASMLVAPRVFYAFGLSGDLPRTLAAVHPAWRTPWAGIVLFAVLAVALALSGTFEYLITILIIARLTAYASSSAALFVLRRRDGPAPVSIPGGRVIAAAALLLCAAVMTTVPPTSLRDVAIALAVGFAVRGCVQWRDARSKVPAGRESP